ncbi:MAG: hypothetical protein Q8Q09_20150 [Deltaproteobacteria bacterium]|nr:hypothetical protein [Deltaproteobacteria bacterium]
MSSYQVCPCCARHVRASESACPFCQQNLSADAPRTPGLTPWYALAAVASTLALGGCPMMMARYGAPPEPSTAAAPAARDTPAQPAQPAQPAPSQRESYEIYGAPPPPPDHDH